MQDVILELDGISKTFDDKKVLNSFSLEIKRNEFITLLGPSGCGKSTTLRIIGGFEKPDKGRVLFDGKDITNLTPDKRNVNTVFQKYSLFPHMNVEENIAFGLKLKKKSQQYVKDKIAYALKLVNMEGYMPGKEIVILGSMRSAAPCRCPAGSSSGWPLPGLSSTSPRCCFWTSPWEPWT